MTARGETVPACPSVRGTLWPKLSDRIDAAKYRPAKDGKYAAPSKVAAPDGSMKIAVLLVQFQQDSVASTSGGGQFLVDGQGPATSMGDTMRLMFNKADTYFRAASYGKLSLSYTVFDTLPIVLSDTAGRYAQNGAGVTAMWQEAMAQVDTQVGFGYYDLVAIFHAAGQKQITSRPGDFTAQLVDDFSTFYTDTQTGDTVSLVMIMACPPGDFQPIDSTAQTATLFHEIGHAFGLPDLYSSGGGQTPGINQWGLMGAGNYLGSPSGETAAFMDPWCREFLGWLDTVVITADTIGVLSPSESDSKIYKIYAAAGVDTEYYLFEYRKPIARLDTAFGDGMLIWHIDNNMGSLVSNNVQDLTAVAHRRVDVVEADSSDVNVVNADSGDPWPGAQNKTYFGDKTAPSSRPYTAGVPARFEIENIFIYNDTRVYFAAFVRDTGPKIWFVNDTHTSADSFTYAGGSDTLGAGTRDAPFRSVAYAMRRVMSGDTVYIDAGVYGDTYVHISTTETAAFSIDTDNVTIIGRDSASTIIDPPGDSNIATMYGIYADSQHGLTIKNLAVRGAYNGIYFVNVYNSMITHDSVTLNGNAGVYFLNGSDSNRIEHSAVSFNSVNGVDLSASSGCTVLYNLTDTNGGTGINLQSSNGNRLDSNTVRSNSGNGISVTQSSWNAVRWNTAKWNVTNGISMPLGTNNTVQSNIVTWNQNNGIDLPAASHGNIISHNLVRRNALSGILVDGDTVVVTMNEIGFNDTGILVTAIGGGFVNGIVIAKNNFETNAVNHLYNPTGGAVTLNRNWWTTTDEVTIDSRVTDTSSSFIPYRLGPVDTAADGDTTAPHRPSGVTCTAATGYITVTWTIPTIDEETNGTPNIYYGGARIYRSTSADTTNWANSALLVRTTSSTETQWHDTGATSSGTTYYYRLTSFDTRTISNQSFFTDTKSATAPVAATGVTNWYVNDTYTASDSYTYAGGSDTTYGDGTASKPFRSILKALAAAKAGDTIFVDAGFYDSYTTLSGEETIGIRIDTNNISIIGKDSGSTVIDPPGDSSNEMIACVYADTQSGLLIRNLGFTGANLGIIWIDCDSSAIVSNSFIKCASPVSFQAGSDSNIVSNNVMETNSSQGVRIESSQGNTIRNNLIRSNAGGAIGIESYSGLSSAGNLIDGNIIQWNRGAPAILLQGGARNVFINNMITGNADNGMMISDSHNIIDSNTISSNDSHGVMVRSNANYLRHNLITGNAQAGLALNGDSNIIVQNNIIGNDTGIWLNNFGSAAWVGNVISKNNILSNTTNAFYNQVSGTASISRNYWGTTDEVAMAAKISDGVNSFRPYRFAAADTRNGADTTAPFPPTGVTCTAATGYITVTWAIPNINEETNGGSVGYSGAYIYRSISPDTTNWANAANLVRTANSTETQWHDTGATTAGATYYYRLAAFDAASLVNQSFFTDTKSATVASTVTNWYVNDTYTASDSFTYAGGSDTAYGDGTVSKPFRSVARALAGAKSGDVIYVDAGLYSETGVTVNGGAGETAAFKIDTDYITIIGKDSDATVFDPPGLASTAGVYGIYADTQKGLVIKNLAVIGSYYGIYFFNVDSSTVWGNSLSGSGKSGIYLTEGSETNTISKNHSYSNSEHGISLFGATQNVISNNNVTLNSFFGINLTSSNSNTVSNNSVTSNTSNGIYLSSSTRATVTGNTCTGNLAGIYLTSATEDTITGNALNANSYGIYFDINSNSNYMENNTANSNTQYGYYVTSTSLYNLFVHDTANSNTQYGIYIVSVYYDTFFGCVTNSNGISGVNATFSHSLNFYNGVSRSNAKAGFHINGTDTVTMIQNEITGNDTGLWMSGVSSGVTAIKNNIVSNTTKNVHNESTRGQTLTRNWFGTTDSLAISQKFADTVNAFTPYRLGAVDTAIGKDTVAPKAPDTVAIVNKDTSLILEWKAVTTNEDGDSSAVALGGYRVYRSKTKDTSLWPQVASVASTSIRYQDTDVKPSVTYYYRVTSFDTHTYVNESYFSDSQPGDSPAYYSVKVWYVNDTSTTGDSYTTAVGADTNMGSVASSPFRHIVTAMRFVTEGDTVYVDAGIYDSYMVVSATETAGVRIDTDGVAIIGKDSSATVIDPPGDSAVSSPYGIYADTQIGIAVKNIGVTGARYGILFVNVDRSTLISNKATANGDYGFALINSSDTNSIRDNIANFNGVGIFVDSGSFNNIMYNTANSNSGGLAANAPGAGIYLLANSACTVSGNSAQMNSAVGNPAFAAGIYISACTGVRISDNVTNSNHGQGGSTETTSCHTGGIMLMNSTNCLVTQNSSAYNAQLLREGLQAGIRLISSSYNTIEANTTTFNFDISIGPSSRGGGIGIFLTTASNYNVISGNHVSRDTNGVFLEMSHSNLVTRNRFSSSDTAVVFSNADSNVVSLNDFNNVDTAIVSLSGISKNNHVSKNNFNAASYSNISDTDQFLARNWWGATNEDFISSRMVDTPPGFAPYRYIPYRLGTVDTSAGADTTAPAAPLNVSATAGSNGQILLTWTIPTVNEETNGGSVGYAGARVYRLANAVDTTNWGNSSLLVWTAGPTDTGWTDTTASSGNTYYYRLSSFDAATFVNRSFFSDTKSAKSTRNIWYVNDTYTAADSYTYAGGSDTSYGDGSQSRPFRSIPRAMQVIKSGDTVYVDAGLYDSYMTVSSTEIAGVRIDTDYLAIIGKDSNATVIDPPGAGTTFGLYGVYADTHKGLLISGIGVIDAYDGFHLENIDSSIIISSSSSANGNNGFYISYADSLILTNSVAANNSSSASGTRAGFYLHRCMNSRLDGNQSSGHAGTTSSASKTIAGFYLYASDRNLIRSNWASTNSAITGGSSTAMACGIILDSCLSNIVETNTASLNTVQDANTLAILAIGIYLTNSSNNLITGNIAESNAAQLNWSGAGIYDIYGTGNTITGNSANSNSGAFNGTGYGIVLQTCSNDTLSNNVANNNYNSGGLLKSSCGIYARSCTSIIISGNRIGFNSSIGIRLVESNANHLTMNRITNNSVYGLYLDTSSGNTVQLNTFDSNGIAQIVFDGFSTSDTFSRNNIYATLNPDSAVIYDSGALPSMISALVNFSRNWWGTTDEAQISKGILQSTGADSVIWRPYRLGAVDTSAGADTTAPAAPSNVSATAGANGQILLTWTIPTVNEETNGGSVGYAGARVHRLANAVDTTNWGNSSLLVWTAGPTDTGWTDTTASSGNTYHYRLSSFDAATFVNRSFFSDTKSAKSTRNIWYVNDTYTAADSYTYAGGSDTSYGDGSPSKPFRSIPRAMQVVKSGDTVYVDAGLYDSYMTVSATETAGVRIDTDYVSIIGKDSSATVVDPPGATVVGLYGIYASTRVGLLIKNIGITGTYDGIRFDNVDRSTVYGDSVIYSSNYGIYLQNGSDTNTVSDNTVNFNLVGIFLSSSSGNIVSGNNANLNTNNGIQLSSSSANTVSGNMAKSNSFHGILLSSSSYNTVSNNTADSNSSSGFYMTASPYNILIANTSNSNLNSGFLLDATSDTNMLSSNNADSNLQYGIYLSSSSSCTISMNKIRGTGRSGVYLYDAPNHVISGNTFAYTGISPAILAYNVATKNNVIRDNVFDSVAIGVCLTYADSSKVVGNQFSNNVANNDSCIAILMFSSNYTIVQQNVLVGHDTGIWFAQSGNTYNIIVKNNFINNLMHLQLSDGETTNVISRNWWDTSDEVQIRSRILDTSLVFDFRPYRLGPVDTSSGGDTTAPLAPANVTLDTSTPAQIKVAWAIPTVNEETNGGSVGYAGAKVYRLANAVDTNNWANVANLVWVAGATDTTWVDTGVMGGQTYYYRLTSFDAATFVNQSFFTDTKWAKTTTYAKVTLFEDSSYTDDVDTYLTRDHLFIEVRDSDENKNAGVAETVTVTVYVCNGTLEGDTIGLFLDTETITLTEVGVNSGIFRCSEVIMVDTKVPVVGDKWVSWGVGDTLFVLYVDPDGSGDSSFDTALALEIKSASAIQLYEDAGYTDDVDTFVTRDVLYVQVQDTDENRNPQRKDTISVTIYVGNDITGMVTDTERVELTETTETSGIFRLVNGINLTDTAASLPNNGFLTWATNDTLHVVYQDVFGGTGDSSFDTALLIDTAVQPYTGPIWYVNDTSTVGDAFTSSIGYDTSAGVGSAVAPFRTIIKAIATAKAGETIYVDAGYYDSYTHVTAGETAGIRIDTDYLSIIGKDSNSTVIDPRGESGITTMYGVYADSQIGILIKNLAVRGAYHGIYFVNVDSSTVSGDSLSSNGYAGIYFINGSDSNLIWACAASYNAVNGIDLTGSSGGTIMRTVADSNGGSGINIQSSTSVNVVNNITRSNAGNGIAVTQSSGNRIDSNTSMWNAVNGISLPLSTGNVVANNNVAWNKFNGIDLPSASHRNHILRNRIARNTLSGILVDGDTNIISLNDITGSDTGIQVTATGGGSGIGIVISKNNIETHAVNALYNPAGATLTLVRNWWGTTDEITIDSKVTDTVSVFIPYRFGLVDTFVGADTTAPLAPVGVGIDTGTYGQIKLTWTIPTVNEETNGGSVGYAGAKIYRLRAKPDTTNWANGSNLAFIASSSATSWTDTNVVAGDTYYYRLTSIDGATYTNQSFFTDTKWGVVQDTLPRTWYVNDTYTASDSFTYAGGSDTWWGIGTKLRPFRSPAKAMQFVMSGDTIYVDAGLFSDTYVVAAAGGSAAFKFDTDYVSVIGKDSGASVIDPPGAITTSNLYGIYASTRVGLTIKNLGITGSYYGVYFSYVDSSFITSDSICSNGYTGIFLNNSNFDSISGNITMYNGSAGSSFSGGISFDASSWNSIHNHLSENDSNGINLYFSNNNRVYRNHILSTNKSQFKPSMGIGLRSASLNSIVENIIDSHGVGISLGVHGNIQSDSFNIISQNRISNCDTVGIHISGGSSNTIIFNDLINNDTGVLMTTSSYGFVTHVNNNLILKNNFYRSKSTHLWIVSDSANFVLRNYWGTTDEGIISSKFSDTSSSFRPFRLGTVDTSLGADTTAPLAPVNVGIDTATANVITLSWTIPTANEETNGGSVGYAGAKIYRLTNQVDTTNWANSANLVWTASSGATSWVDTTVTPGNTYFYRLTSIDGAAIVNQSFFTDTKWGTVRFDTGIRSWYVNDTYTASDSFTYAGGSDTSYGAGTSSKPYRSVAKALQNARSGDTIYVDAGLYNDTYVTVSSSETAAFKIDTDYITIIGKDSNATVIDPPGLPTTPGLYGIYGDTQVGITIKNIGVTGADYGIRFENVNRSNIIGDSCSSNRNAGIYLINNSDSNTMSNNMVDFNTYFGIYLSSSANNTLSNNATTSNTNGIYLEACTSSILSNNIANSNTYGIYLSSCASSTLSNNTAKSNLVGISLSASHSNTLSGNVADLNSRGIEILSSDSNTVSNNTTNWNMTGISISGNNAVITGNTTNSHGGIILYASNGAVTGNTAETTGAGIVIYGSNNVVSGNVIGNATQTCSGGIGIVNGASNIVRGNRITNVLDSGILILSDSNVIELNEISVCDSGVIIAASAKGNIVSKNNIFNARVSYIYNASGFSNSIKRNWFGVTDEMAITDKVLDTVNAFRPYRLGPVDTSAGADTTAPLPPVNVGIDTSTANVISLSWTIPTVNEETNGGSVGYAGAKIYRLANQVDTTNWANSANLVWTASSGATSWIDTTVTAGSTYYYRLTSFDAATFVNQSFFTDTKWGTVQFDTGPRRWYVNDTYNASTDSFTYAGGSDTSYGAGTAVKPYRSVAKALQSAKSGDTIYVDAGLYTDTSVAAPSIGGTCAFNIDTDYITIIGKDSNATVFDPIGSPGDASVAGIHVDTQVGIAIRNIGVYGGYYGIYFWNVDRSTVAGDSLCYNGGSGISLNAWSETNLIIGNVACNNWTGIYVNTGCHGNSVFNNIASSNSNSGIILSGSSGDTVVGNTADSNALYGIYLSAAGACTVAQNTVTANSQYGIYAASASTGNWISDNAVRASGIHGIYIVSGSDANLILNNRIDTNTQAGIVLSSSGSARIRNNLIRSNGGHGLQLSSSSNNVVSQNTFDGNAGYAAHISGSSSSDTFIKNNFLSASGNTDSAVVASSSVTSAKFAFTRNWWDTTDEIRIRKMASDSANPSTDSVSFIPYRLGPVDTSTGADTTAPLPPVNVGIDTSTGGVIALSWTIPTANEETNGGSVGYAGAKIYRLTNLVDTTNWANSANLVWTASSGATSWSDTMVTAGNTYYYRLTSFDGAAVVNQSFFTDTKWGTAQAAATGPTKWYVNDTYSMSSDSFTYAGGSDTSYGDGTQSKPYRSVAKALQGAKSGDTIYVDAGRYVDTYVLIGSGGTETAAFKIDTDYITIIGKDSNATVIDPPGAASAPGIYGIYADTQVGLTIRNLGVTGAYDGIHFQNVDSAILWNDSVSACGNIGVNIYASSDSVVIANCAAILNSGMGIKITTGWRHLVLNNLAIRNTSVGIYLEACTNALVSGNIVTSNAQGIELSTCTGNAVVNNILSGNTAEGLILYAANANVIRGNLVSNNLNGLSMISASNNVVFQNTFDSNSNYQIYVDQASISDTVTKNNIKPPSATPDSGVWVNSSVTGNKFDFRRNRWGSTTDEIAIRRMVNGSGNADSVSWIPYRIDTVDTTATGDTTAPHPPTNVGIDTGTAGRIKLTWTIPTINEETNGGSVGFKALGIYRISGATDTTNWANSANLVWISGTADTSWDDTTVTAGTTYYYRLTSVDSATFTNQSFFTDTKWGTAQSSGGSATGRVDSITIDTGNQQLGAVSTRLTLPFRVRLTDSSGAAVAYAPVKYSIGYPSSSGGYFRDSSAFTTSDSGFTDTNGYFSDTFTIGTKRGVYQIIVTTDSKTTLSKLFYAYADGIDIEATKWKMVGFNKSPSSATFSGLTSGLSSPTGYGWNEDAGISAGVSEYQSLSSSSTASRGRSYWVYSTAAGSITQSGTAGFDTVTATLKAGWSMVATGQYFYVDWDSGVQFDTNGTKYYPNAADSKGIIKNVVFWYSGSGYYWGPDVNTAQLSRVQLKPNVGFWIYAAKACTISIYPNPVSPAETSTLILQQAPAWNAETFGHERARTLGTNGHEQYGEGAAKYSKGAEEWVVRIAGVVGGVNDFQNYIGVKTTADAAARSAVYDPPAAAGGYVSVGIRPVADGGVVSGPRLAASYVEPITTVNAWNVSVASDLDTPVTLTWEGAAAIPTQYDAYLIGGPQGPVNLRQAAAIVLPQSATAGPQSAMTIVIGLPQYLAAFMAAPLSKEMSFVYPNPGPDGTTGNMTFTYNLPASAQVTLRIFDVGGRLVRDLAQFGAAGTNTWIWDTTNRSGQKLGSGVYIYILQSGSNRLVDKLAIVR